MGFQRAVRYKKKARVSFVGPPGSGKTRTALILARALAGPGGTIAATDSEAGSMKSFADQFDFDVDEPATFEQKVFMNAIRGAEAGGYAVFICDSFSHFWMGPGGALEFVDRMKAASRDKMDPWNRWRPLEREMFEAIIRSPIHVITTMRTKNEYVEEEVNGQKKRKKIGLAPVQREGTEYENDLVIYMDPDGPTMSVDKSRCDAMNGVVARRPTEKTFAPYVEWLEGGAEAPPPRPNLREQALKILVPASAQGMAALEAAYKLMSNEMRKSVLDEMPALKEQAAHAAPGS